MDDYRFDNGAVSFVVVLIALLAGLALVVLGPVVNFTPWCSIDLSTSSSSTTQKVFAQSGLYSYKNSEGKINFVDDLDKVPDRYKSVVKKRDDLPVLSKVPGKTTSSDEAFANSKQVTILVADWCGYCRQLEAFLTDKNIPYTRLDIESDQKGRTLYQKYGTGGVPITLVGKKVIRGFNPQAIILALSDSQLSRRY